MTLQQANQTTATKNSLSPSTVDTLIAATAGMLREQENILAKGGELSNEQSVFNAMYAHHTDAEGMPPAKAQAAANDYVQRKRQELMAMARQQAVLLSEAIDELRPLKGRITVITDAKGIKLAGPVTAGKIRRLLVTADVSPEWAEGCLRKAGVSRWEDVSDEQAAKVVTYLLDHQRSSSAATAAAPPIAYARSYSMYFERAMEIAQDQGVDAKVAGTTVYEDAKRAGDGDVGKTTDVWRSGRLDAMEQDRYDWRTGEVITDAKVSAAAGAGEKQGAAS